MSVIVEQDIRRAATLPGEFYSSHKYYELAKEHVFARSWQFLTDLDRLKKPGSALPITLLEGVLDEPLLLSRDGEDNLHCLSNVCTHRGNLLVEGECTSQLLRCRYHGRCFSLDGRFVSTPGFDGALDFPGSGDDLPAAAFATFKKFIFAGITPDFEFQDLMKEMEDRVGWMPFDEFILDPTSYREYLVQANWALYCDNYLEGFHIPYVHPALAATLDAKAYRCEIFKYSNLQVGITTSPKEAFELPTSSPDYGQLVAAYYFWLFPNTMFNFYPWGLSVNVVVPLSVNKTKIRYYSYIWHPDKQCSGAGSDLDRVEREDEDIVEKVQKGIRARLYTRGRYSPQWETGVHHFHQLLSRFLAPGLS